MIHRHDRSNGIQICPIQTPLGQSILVHYGLEVANPSTWLFLDQGVAYQDSDAIIRIGRYLGQLGFITSLVRVFPRPLRDWLYQRLARNRYALFGSADLCALPDPAFQKRLLR